MQGTVIWVMALLGLVGFFVLEGIKFLNKRNGQKLDSRAVLWLLMAVSLSLTVLGGVISGELSLSEWVGAFKTLPADPVLALSAVIVLAEELIIMFGMVVATATVFYTALKKRMQDNDLLSYSIAVPEPPNLQPPVL